MAMADTFAALVHVLDVLHCTAHGEVFQECSLDWIWHIGRVYNSHRTIGFSDRSISSMLLRLAPRIRGKEMARASPPGDFTGNCDSFAMDSP
jgi:hypothetical protein